MKKSEAEKKICPFMSGASNQYGYLTNGYHYDTKRDRTVFNETLCKTDKCMAWQFTKKDYEIYYCEIEERNVRKDFFKDSKEKTDHGYCKRLNK